MEVNYFFLDKLLFYDFNGYSKIYVYLLDVFDLVNIFKLWIVFVFYFFVYFEKCGFYKGVLRFTDFSICLSIEKSHDRGLFCDRLRCTKIIN